MSEIQLVTLEPAIGRALAEDPEFFPALGAEEWTRAAEIVHRHVGRTLTAVPVTIDQLHWGGYFTVDSSTREIVGSCAYKSAPSDDGVVEIAYFTYDGFEGRGYATAMATRLIALARESPAVHRIIAHTRPVKNASTRVLEKVGCTFVGEVIEPEDGLVWRWEVRTQRAL